MNRCHYCGSLTDLAIGSRQGIEIHECINSDACHMRARSDASFAEFGYPQFVNVNPRVFPASNASGPDVVAGVLGDLDEIRADQLRTSGRFFFEAMHPTERRMMFVAVVLFGGFFLLFETDAEGEVLPKQDAVALNMFREQNIYSLLKVDRIAFDPRKCSVCGSTRHPLAADLSPPKCASQWGCSVRAQRAQAVLS